MSGVFSLPPPLYDFKRWTGTKLFFLYDVLHQRQGPHTILASQEFVLLKMYSCHKTLLNTTPWRRTGSVGIPPRILSLGTRWRRVGSFTLQSLFLSFGHETGRTSGTIKHRSEERIVRNGDGNDINDWTGSLVWHSLLSFLLQYSANLSVSVIIYQNA